jgi:deoxyribodipyrimidine photolyase-related protein
MTTVALVYPHQLFANHPAVKRDAEVWLIEDPLSFTQYDFHRRKLAYHRLTMAVYADELRSAGHVVRLVAARELPHSQDLIPLLLAAGVTRVRYVDPCDDWLERRLSAALKEAGIAAEVLADPDFLTDTSWIDNYAAAQDRFYFTDFYRRQRLRLGVLLEPGGKPVGGQWSFDPDNRKKLPRGLVPPNVTQPPTDPRTAAIRAGIHDEFPRSLGTDDVPLPPITRAAASAWLDEFLSRRLTNFGDYEDAISRDHAILFHGVLTPMLNVGLLSPRDILDRTLAYAAAHPVPLNALEGFIRQVIGWREYMRLVYRSLGRRQRTRNFFGFTQSMPRAAYTAETGLAPVDHVIRGVLRTAYCHHIERLMILGNFCLLCEIHPDAVYRWFMELFIDAYDWVMVPNIYGMSQYADGGLITTKPYISGSSYVLKMSDFPRGHWCLIWDALYWRFVHRHRAVFAANPRVALMTKQLDRMGPKLAEHLRIADEYLARLHGG